MNNYEDWSQIVAKRLRGEADVIAAIEKNELDDTAATDAFVRAVLEPFLPEHFGVGAGRIVDAFGNCSEHLDVVVFNRDFPRIGMNGASPTYLYESVLAAFSLRAKFVRKTFFESLNISASLAHLETNIDKAVLVKLAKKNGLRPGPNKTFVHEDPLRAARFELIGRPPVFVFGFSGIKYSYRQLQENLELWIKQRQDEGIKTPMKALPAVIATQGSFAWRNAAPLALSNREMMGIGNDAAPVRLIVLQLLYLLNRRLNVTADGYGLKPNLNAYLSQFSVPKFEIGVGDLDTTTAPTQAGNAAAPASANARYEPAKDHASSAEPAPELELPNEVEVDHDPVAEAPAHDDQFEKTSPFGSIPEPAPAPEDSVLEALVPEAPAPKAQAPEAPTLEAPAPEAPVKGGQFDKPSPFASAPVPPPTEDSKPVRTRAPAASLGSAPIPSMEPAAPIVATKPPVDIEFGEDDTDYGVKAEPKGGAKNSSSAAKPPAAETTKKTSRNSTDAFIARVKNQLASPEPLPEKDQDFYSLTIPQ